MTVRLSGSTSPKRDDQAFSASLGHNETERQALDTALTELGYQHRLQGGLMEVELVNTRGWGGDSDLEALRKGLADKGIAIEEARWP